MRREAPRPLPRSLTPLQMQARSTRPDLWPTFRPPPHLPPLPARTAADYDDELDDLLDDILDPV